MIGRFALRSHTGSESVGESKDPLRSGSVGALAALHFEPLLEGGDHRRRETFASEASQLRSQ